MNNQLKTTLLCCLLPIISWTQNAFTLAESLSLKKYEEIIYADNLPVILDAYAGGSDFTTEEKAQVETIVDFAKNPFGVKIDVATFPIESIATLLQAIEANAKRKEKVYLNEYELARACTPSLPEQIDVFLDNSIFFSETDLACFQEKYLEKHGHTYDPPDPYLTETRRDWSDDEGYAAQFVPPALSLPTKIIDATSQFLVLRVKEELLLAFFNDFLEKIRESRELTTLLPNTYFLLENSDIFKAPSMGAAWVTAFEEDLEQFPQQLEHLLLTTPEYAEVRGAASTQMFLLTSDIYQRIESGVGLDIWQLIEEHYSQFSDSEFYLVQLLGLADLVRDNLRKQATGTWYTEADLNKLLKMSKHSAIYFAGLLYQQNRDMFKKISVPIAGEKVPLPEALQGDAAEFIRAMYGLLRAGNKLNANFQKIITTQSENAANAEETPEDKRAVVTKLAASFFDFLDKTTTFLYIKEPTAFLHSDYNRLYKPLAFETLATLDAALEKDYGKLLMHSTQLLQPIVEARIIALERTLVGLPDTEQRKTRKQIKRLNEFIRTYLYYGGFIVDVLSASTTDEVHFIIDKYAAPAQSYRVNRQSDFSMNVGAYPGLYIGYERSDSALDDSPVTGVTAPIGLSLSLGKQKVGFRKPSSSISLFLPIIDIGAPFSYRWQNDSTGFPANLTWRQILSPGAHLVWGLGDTPLALTLGAQYTPELRKVTETNLEFQANAWRVGASLTVDIPIFYLKR